MVGLHQHLHHLHHQVVVLVQLPSVLELLVWMATGCAIMHHLLLRVAALEERQSALVLRVWMVPGYAIGTPLHNLQVVAPVQHPSVVVLLVSMESGLVGHRLNPTLQFVLEPTAQVKTRK